MSASRPRPPPRRGDGSRHSKTSQATSSSTSTSLQVPSSSSAASYGPDLRTERASKGKERESGFFVELPGGSISSRPRFSSPRKQGPKSSEDEKHEQARVDGSCADEGTIDAEVERMAQLAVMTGASADAHVGQASRSNPPPARSFKGKRASRMTDPDAQTINSTVRQSPPRSASNLQSTRSRPQPPPGRFARTHKASGTDQAGAAGPSSSSTASEAETIRMDVEQSGAESSTTSGPQSARRAARTPIRSQTAAQKDANFIDAGDHLVGSTSEANSEAMEIDGELGAAREQSPSRAPRPAPRPVRATHKMRREPRIAVKRADWPDEKRLACVRLNGSPDPGSLAVSSFGCVAITTPKVIHIITPSLTFSTAQKPNLTLFSPGTMEDLSGELSSAFYSSIEVSCVVQMMRLRAKFEDGMDARNAFTHDYMLGHPGSGLPVWRKAAWCPALLGDQGGPVLAIQTAMMDLYLFQPKPGAFPGSMVYKERLEAPATKVQFERRKRQVMLNEQISDMAWLDFAPEAVASTCAYLVGSSRSGKLYVWRCHQSAPSDFMLQANVADFPIDYVVASKCKTNSDGARSAIVATFYSGTLDFLNVALDPAGQISIERVTNAARPLNVGISVPTWLDDDYLYFGTPGAIMRYTPGAAAEMETALLGEREDDQPGEAMSTCIQIESQQSGMLHVTLKDGNHYILSSSDFCVSDVDASIVLPACSLVSPFSSAAQKMAIDLQREYDFNQGLIGYASQVGASGGARLKFAVHRANELGFFRHSMEGAFSFTLILSGEALAAETSPEESAQAALASAFTLHAGADKSHSTIRLSPFFALLETSARRSAVLTAGVDTALSAAQNLLPESHPQAVEDERRITALRTVNLLLLKVQNEKSLPADIQLAVNDAAKRVSRALQSSHLLFQLEAAHSHIQGSDTRDVRGDTSADLMFCQRLVAAVYLAERDEQGSAIFKRMESLAWKLLQSMYRVEKIAKTARDALRADAREHLSVQCGEVCPACDADVPLVAIGADGVTRCRTGHIWSRCSVTWKPLGEVRSRTCIGCNRKAYPVSLGEEGSQLLNEALNTSRHCITCGAPWTIL